MSKIICTLHSLSKTKSQNCERFFGRFVLSMLNILFSCLPPCLRFLLPALIWISLKNVCKSIFARKLTWNGKFYLKHNTDQSRFCLQSSYCTSSRAFVPLVSVLQLSSSKVSLAVCWASSASHLVSSLVPAFASAPLSDSSLAFIHYKQFDNYFDFSSSQVWWFS